MNSRNNSGFMTEPVNLRSNNGISFLIYSEFSSEPSIAWANFHGGTRESYVIIHSDSGILSESASYEIDV